MTQRKGKRTQLQRMYTSFLKKHRKAYPTASKEIRNADWYTFRNQWLAKHPRLAEKVLSRAPGKYVGYRGTGGVGGVRKARKTRKDKGVARKPKLNITSSNRPKVTKSMERAIEAIVVKDMRVRKTRSDKGSTRKKKTADILGIL